jgi:hypothetical protein
MKSKNLPLPSVAELDESALDAVRGGAFDLQTIPLQNARIPASIAQSCLQRFREPALPFAGPQSSPALDSVPLQPLQQSAPPPQNPLLSPRGNLALDPNPML